MVGGHELTSVSRVKRKRVIERGERREAWTEVRMRQAMELQ